jgi:hypothetical protein
MKHAIDLNDKMTRRRLRQLLYTLKKSTWLIHVPTDDGLRWILFFLRHKTGFCRIRISIAAFLNLLRFFWSLSTSYPCPILLNPCSILARTCRLSPR